MSPKEDFGEEAIRALSKIPFNLFTLFNTRSSYRTIIRSIERDGGRRLEGFAGELWWDRRSVRPDALQRQKDQMIP